MVAIVRSVNQLSSEFRKAIEHAVGQPLRDEQQVTIQVSEPPAASAAATSVSAAGRLPEWCGVYEGLSAEEVATLESAVLQRADLGRSFE
jgi:hypothetical protein